LHLNNNFIKSGVQLYFSEGMGIFTRTGCDGTLSKIIHRFSILPENRDLFITTKRMKEYKSYCEELRFELYNQTLI